MSVDTQPGQDASLSFPEYEPTQPRKSFWGRYYTIIILAIILIFAAFFRFYGRDFDQGTNQHPDERAIVDHTIPLAWPASFNQLLDPTQSTLNLRVSSRYPWGALPVYVARGGAMFADYFVSIFKPQLNGYYLHDYHGAQLVGRTMASIFDLITVLLVFLIARRLYSARTALIATALVAFSVTNIQIAHFYITEPFLVTFMMASLYFTVVLMQKPSWWAAVGAGAFLGFSVATKVSSALIFVMIVTAILLRAGYRKHSRKLGAALGDPTGMKPATTRERERSFWSHTIRGLRYFLIATILGVLAFAITEPYALWQFDFSQFHAAPGASQNLGESVKNLLMSNPWGRGIVEEAGTQSGSNANDVPYTRQYVGTIPVLYHFEQVVFWGVGVVPGLVIIAGILLAFWLAVKRRPAELLLLSFALPYFATILVAETKWMRYMLPLVPVFCILGAALLVRGAAWAAERWPRRAFERGFSIRAAQRNFFPILTVGSILFALLWSCAYMNIYSQDESRVQAAHWLNTNGTAGATVSHEVWDDGLPDLRGFDTGDAYSFDLYADHPALDELNYIQGQMAKTDYIVETSDRLYQSISRMPWRYPVQIAFYQMLYGGKLGYQLVHTEQVTPSIFGLNWNDQLADESFTVYDHPRVDIFKKITTLTTDQLRLLFASALDVPPSEYSTLRHDTIPDDKSLMLDTTLSDQPDVGNYAWNPLAQTDTQWGAVLFWLLAVYLISFAAIPVVFTVFRRLPDRGYAFAKLAGLVVVTYGTWLLASGHVIPFTTWSVLGVLLALAALSVVVWRLGAAAEIRAFVKQKRNLIIYYEILFLAAFAFMLFIRILNPDVWHTVYGGEKTMEVGFLNSALRSPWMPPADPFFAGGYVNYYYQGQFLIACLIKLVGVDPAIAYNLSFPLLFGLCFTAAASIVYNIVAWSRRLRGSIHAVSRVGMAFGVLAGVLYLFIGNMHSLFEWVLITFPRSASTLLAWGRNLNFIGPSWNSPYTTFNFWDPSRIIPGTINEFPYWSFLYGDMHPHLIDMAFTMLTVGLAVNLAFAGRFVSLGTRTASWFQTTRNSVSAVLNWIWGTGGAGLLTFSLAALALGNLFVTNSWDFPTFAGLTGGAVLIAVLLSRRVPPAPGSATPATDVAIEDVTDPPIGARGGLVVAVTAFVSVGLLAGVALLAYLPFFLTFKAFFTKLMFIADGGTVPGSNAIMHRTTIWEFLVVWGIFVFIGVTYLLVRLWNFPWRDSLIDLFGIVPSSGRTTPRREIVSTVASSSQTPLMPEGTPRASRLRRATLRLAPAYSDSDAAGWTAAFSGSGTEDEPITTPTMEGTGPTDPVANGAGGAADAGPFLEPDSFNQAIPPSTNGYTTEVDATPNEALNSWVADAHTQVERERRVVMRTIDSQPGVIPLWLGFAILAATAAATVLQIVTGQPLMALLLALIGGITGTLLATTRSVAALTGGLLLVVALLVTIGLEVVYLADFMSGGDQYRSNTVFKFYIQAWGLFAVGGAASIYYILFGLRDSVEKKRTRTVTQTEVIPADGQESRTNGAPIADAPNRGSVTPALIQVAGDATGQRAYTSQLSQNGGNNWLSWSTDAIERASTDTGPLPVAPEPTAPLETPSTLTVGEPPIPQVAMRRLRRATLPEGVTYTPPTPQAQVEPVSTVENYDIEVIPEQKPPDLLRFRWSIGKAIWAVLFAFLLAVGFLYPLYGTPSKVRERVDPNAPLGTLNGLSYMQNATFSPNLDAQTSVFVKMKYDLEGINWLNQHVTGLHTIAELPLEYYRAGGMRVASNTGLPMVIGGLHQEEQRSDAYARLVGDRRNDMNMFFTTPNVQTALTIISKYDIDYIYLGQVEQAKAGDSGVKKFAQMADPKVGLLTEVFRSDNPASVPGTVIYQVNHGERDPRNFVGSPVEGSGLPGISITPLPTSTPIPAPPPPVDDPVPTGLRPNVTANPRDHDARQKLVDWYRDHNFPSQAAEQLEILVSQNPTDVSIRSQLGDMYQTAGQPDKALQVWEEARDVAPDNPDAHNKVGLAYVDRKRFTDALTEFQAAVTARSSFVESYFHMGEVYEILGDKANAIKAYQSTLDNSQGENRWKTQAQARLNAIQ